MEFEVRGSQLVRGSRSRGGGESACSAVRNRYALFAEKACRSEGNKILHQVLPIPTLTGKFHNPSLGQGGALKLLSIWFHLQTFELGELITLPHYRQS